jgi:hypothetical protein
MESERRAVNFFFAIQPDPRPVALAALQRGRLYRPSEVVHALADFSGMNELPGEQWTFIHYFYAPRGRKRLTLETIGFVKITEIEGVRRIAKTEEGEYFGNALAALAISTVNKLRERGAEYCSMLSLMGNPKHPWNLFVGMKLGYLKGKVIEILARNPDRDITYQEIIDHLKATGDMGIKGYYDLPRVLDSLIEVKAINSSRVGYRANRVTKLLYEELVEPILEMARTGKVNERTEEKVKEYWGNAKKREKEIKVMFEAYEEEKFRWKGKRVRTRVGKPRYYRYIYRLYDTSQVHEEKPYEEKPWEKEVPEQLLLDQILASLSSQPYQLEPDLRIFLEEREFIRSSLEKPKTPPYKMRIFSYF